MRVAFAILVAVHGLIHLVGFVQRFRLAALPQLTGQTTFSLPASWDRGLGALWLVACAGLLGSAATFALRSPWFGSVALGSVLVSQLLIVHGFPDAKLGTLVNVPLLIVALTALAEQRFERETRRQVDALLQQASATPPSTVDVAELQALPPPVQRWLTRAGVVGRPRVSSLRLTQLGEMRTAPDAAFMPARASQWFSVEPPGFVWDARITMRGLPVLGRDSYLDGRGRMLITLGGLVPIVDASDERIQQGTLLRFLGEMIWFPSAALSPALRWEPRDEHSAVVHMRHGGAAGSAVLSFDAEDRFVSLNAQRFMGSGTSATLEEWQSNASAYRRFDGIEVPVAGEVTWKLKSGDFTYYRWKITEIEYQ